ncbi:hypothetical protein AHAS_Ahas17G0143600 [Arachis hypogaea]
MLEQKHKEEAHTHQEQSRRASTRVEKVRGTYQILHRALDNVMDEMQEYQTRSKEKSSLTHEEATLNDMNDLQSPPHVRTRGRPKNRLGSNLKKKDLKRHEEK